jgi:hypothetical protein
LIVNTSSGIDGIAISETEVAGSAVIDAGSGNDSIEELRDEVTGAFGGVFLSDLQVSRVLTIVLGTGDDTLDVDDVVVRGTAVVDAGSGNDIVDIAGSTVKGLFLAVMGSGTDELAIFNSVAKRIGLNGGSGADTLETDFDRDDKKILYVLSFESKTFGDDDEDEL